MKALGRSRRSDTRFEHAEFDKGLGQRLFLYLIMNHEPRSCTICPRIDFDIESIDSHGQEMQRMPRF